MLNRSTRRTRRREGSITRIFGILLRGLRELLFNQLPFPGLKGNGNGLQHSQSEPQVSQRFSLWRMPAEVRLRKTPCYLKSVANSTVPPAESCDESQHSKMRTAARVDFAFQIKDLRRKMLNELLIGGLMADWF